MLSRTEGWAKLAPQLRMRLGHFSFAFGPYGRFSFGTVGAVGVEVDLPALPVFIE